MAINKLCATDAAYIAGIIDGEGTITLTRKHKNENRQLAVTVSNTEMKLLHFMKVRIGAGKITRKRTTSELHTPSFTYAIYNRQALDLVSQIKGYLIGYKKKRADLILENYLKLTPRNGYYTDTLKRERRIFEEVVLATKP